MSDTRPFIVVEQAQKRFGSRVVLAGVNVEIAAGETVALIGPSGGGKSTLLRAINGLTPLDAGRVLVDGVELRRGADGRVTPESVQAVCRHVGMIFQDFQLFPHLTALENVIEAPTHVLGVTRSTAVTRARELLDRVGLADRGEAYPDQLSGGQKQRVAIARALAMEPRGLLCDEITSALDPELKHEVLEVLQDLRRDGLTLIVVTHEMGFARRAADRVLVLCDGTVIEQGPPSVVLENPTAARTRAFLQNVLA